MLNILAPEEMKRLCSTYRPQKVTESEKSSQEYNRDKDNSSMECSSTESSNIGMVSYDTPKDGSKTKDVKQITELNQESDEITWDNDNMEEDNVIISSTQQKAIDIFKKGFSNFTFSGRKN